MNTSNKIVNTGFAIKVMLDVYLFLDGDTYIAYSPALDISGYGTSEEDAKNSFSIVMEEYIDYGIKKRTLVKDLRAHGWRVKSLRQHKMAAPSLESLLNSNTTFKDILENREYRKVSQPFPMLA